MWNKKPKEPTEKQKVGRIGEDCACEYLKRKGYKITDRNYLKKWGEIDIVAKQGNKLHFIEVKSVSRTINDPNVPHVTSLPDRKGDYRPEDNVHPWKLQRLSRVIQSYLLDKNVSDETDWQFDVMTVYIDMEKRLSKVFMLDDIVL